jgi:hypothetical protein
MYLNTHSLTPKKSFQPSLPKIEMKNKFKNVGPIAALDLDLLVWTAEFPLTG